MTTAVASVKTDLTAYEDYLKYGSDEERPKGDRSRKIYLADVELYLRWLENAEPTPVNAREFMHYLEEKGDKPTTINLYIWALKSYFRFRKYHAAENNENTPEIMAQMQTALASGDVQAVRNLSAQLVNGSGSPQLNIRGLTVRKSKPRSLSSREWERLYDTAIKPIYDPAVSEWARRRAKLEAALLMCYNGGGLRCSEATHLQVTDVMTEGYLHVIRKGNKEALVPVEDEVIRIIKDWIAVKGTPGPYVFEGKEPGKPMAERTAQGIIKKLCINAGLPDVHIHSLRHTAGRELRKAGAPLNDIQDFLGHENISTTKIYTDLAADDLRRRLPKRFGKPKQARMELV
jgi:integrase/recombinase XerD